MLRHLYKTFVISLLCGSLLSFQSTAVFAAGTNSTDSNGVITNTQSHSFNKISDQDMLTSLAMLGGGFIAGRMVQAYTPLTMDVGIAGAAGAAFIAGEIISNMKFKGTIDAMTIEVQKKSDGKVNEEQLQRLMDLKKSYEEAKQTTKTKKTLQLAAAVGFAAAGATALYLDITENGQVATCKAALTYIKKAFATCIASGTTANPESTTCSACQLGFTSYESLLVMYGTKREIPANSFLADKSTMSMEKVLLAGPKCAPSGPTTISAMSTVKSVCTPAVVQLIRDQASSKTPGGVTVGNIPNQMEQFLDMPLNAKVDYSQFQSRESNFAERFMNFMFPTAEASWLPMLGLSAGVAATFIPMTIATGAEIDLLMYVPRNRAIAWGLFAGVSYMASRASDNVIKKLDENIAKIDEILADLNKNAVGVKAQNVSNQMISVKALNSGSQATIPFNANGTSKSECMQSNSTENCTSLTDQLKSMPGFANLPDSFKDIASQTTSIGDGVSGTTGISGSTLASAEALGNKQKAVAKLLANRQAAAEKLSNGKFNFKKEEDNLLKRINARNKKALEKGGMTAHGMMASIGGAPINASALKEEEKALVKNPVAAGNEIALPAGEGGEKDQTLDLNFKDAAPEMAAADMSGSSSSKEPEYQIDSNEINGQNGPSLFEVISSRYIKSGYPKLLEEETAKKE